MRVLALIAPSALLLACSDDPAPTPATQYHADIRTTSYGVRHISATGDGSLGFALGVVGARDYGCIVADQMIRVRGERSRYFGRGVDDVHFRSDVLHRAFGLIELADSSLPSLPQGVSERMEGFAAGFNQELAEGSSSFAACRGESWLLPITARDLQAYYLSIALVASSAALPDYIVDAAPPGAEPKHLTTGTAVRPRGSGPGSNGWAIGGDLSASGAGMLLANPHFPWNGELRFYEVHLTIPGALDVYGASLLGVPFVVIGFNDDVAWTHTVTPSGHATVYELELAPEDDLAYMYDGEPRPIEEERFEITFATESGELETEERSIYRSHYGFMIEGPGIEWENGKAYTLRDSNEYNWRLPELWARLNAADDLDQVVDIHEETHAAPWVYTIAADRSGDAMLIEASRVPALTPDVEAAVAAEIQEPGIAQLIYDLGFALLDGSTSETEWAGTAEGLVPVSDAPAVRRRDYVANGNGTPWLVNPAAEVAPYSVMYYTYGSPISPRTRTSLELLERVEEPLVLDDLAPFVLDNRGSSAERILPEVQERCEGATPIQVGADLVDIAEACQILRAWNGADDVDSAAGPLWREFLSVAPFDLYEAGGIFEVPFDQNDPLGTPNTVVPAPATGPDPLMVRLALAQQALGTAGFPVGTLLGEMQFVVRDGELSPVPGSVAPTGALNAFFVTTVTTSAIVDDETPEQVNSFSGLTKQGYVFSSGTSFLMTVDLGSSPPDARALLAYSQSPDPTSAHYDDQLALYEAKQMRKVLFGSDDIEADPALERETVSSSPP
jgi:acyl-homoserine-lactone acylase